MPRVAREAPSQNLLCFNTFRPQVWYKEVAESLIARVRVIRERGNQLMGCIGWKRSRR